MTKNIFIVVFIFMSLFSFAQDATPKATWTSLPITIDGEPKEWKMPLRFYDEGTKLFFSFANDDKNLYICLLAPDNIVQTKIMQTGMEISLSAKAKNKVTISFPLPQQAVAEASPAENNDQETMDEKSRHISFVLRNTIMQVDGFAARNGMILINDTSGINAAINWDESDRLTCEIAIPFKEWFGPAYNTTDLLKDIYLDVTVNALKQKRNGGGNYGGSHAGGGRMKGGGMRHEHNANSDGESQVMPGEYKYSLYEKRKLKQKFTLAKNSEVN